MLFWMLPSSRRGHPTAWGAHCCRPSPCGTQGAGPRLRGLYWSCPRRTFQPPPCTHARLLTPTFQVSTRHLPHGTWAPSGPRLQENLKNVVLSFPACAAIGSCSLGAASVWGGPVRSQHLPGQLSDCVPRSPNIWPTPLKGAKEEDETKQAGPVWSSSMFIWSSLGHLHYHRFEKKFSLHLFVCVFF